jgi:hypothetical protein
MVSTDIEIGETMVEGSEQQKTRSRSPSYPGIDLRVAIERAEALYEKEGRHSVPSEVILEDWGYKPGSGGGLVTLAALKKFGLLEDEGARGTRRARLTDLAIRIIHAPTPGEEQRLIREAALTPSLHAELWKKYDGSLPSDKTIKNDLVVERHFTPRGVREFIPQFRETMRFAGLSSGDTIPAREDHAPEKEQSLMTALAPPAGMSRMHGEGEVRAVPIPIGGQQTWPVLQAPYPMTHEQWEQMIDAIRNMERAWTAEPSRSQEVEEGSETTTGATED